MSLRRSLGVLALVSGSLLALDGAGCGSGGGGAPDGSADHGGSGGAKGSAGAGGARGAGGASGTGGASGAGGAAGSGGSKGTGPSDSGLDGGTCVPGAVGGMKFGLNPSARSQGMCTAAQLTGIINDCADNPDASAMAACDTILMDPATKKCLDGCVLTAWTSASDFLTYAPTPWGAVWGTVWGSGANAGMFEYANFGGCIAAAAPGNPAAIQCATDYEEDAECWLAACAPGCPVPAQTSPDFGADFMDFSLCVSASEGKGGPCEKFRTAINADCPAIETDSGPLGVCFDAINVYDTGGSSSAQAHALGEIIDIVCGPSADGGG